MDFIASQSAEHLRESKQVYGMRLAGEEILSNMIRESHGPDSVIANVHIWIHSQVSCSEGNSYFEILLEDDGPRFDPRLEIPRDIGATTPISERPIGGLGLFLVQQSVDEASYQWIDQRNRYRLRIHLEESQEIAAAD